MGYIVTGVSFGLVGGPIIGGILSDKDLLGRLASVSMPFYGALALVLIAIVLVIVFFEDVRMECQPFSFHPSQIFETLWRVTKFPIVLTVLPVYVCFMTANVTFYVFVDNYLTSAFGYGVIGSSAVMLVIGIALAYSSTFLVESAQKRFSKQRIIAASLGVMAASSIAFVASPVAVLCFIPVFAFYFFFGVSYPTLLGIFSGSVEASNQGWVMGITTAVFTLAGGVMSLIGGGLMSVSIRLPFYLVIIAALLGLLAMALVWRNSPAIRHLTDSPARPQT
jgi:DHA1 family tetracycline resistance protein-like MFS transporter